MTFLGNPRCVCAFFGILIAHAALADVPAPEMDRSPASDATAPGSLRTAEPGWLPGSLSVIPGAALHGAGVYMAGDRETARRLLIAEGTGLGMMVAGGLPLMLTHASGQSLDATVSLLLAGSGVFLTSWIADIYGATVGGRSARPPTQAPDLEPYVGYSFVYDPQFDYRHFAVIRLDARRGSFRIAPEAWLAMDADNQRAGLDAAFRLVGARPSGRATDGSFLDFQAGATYHRFGSHGFSIVTTEFLFPGRLDLRRVGPSLAGSFLSFDLGWALEFFGYRGAESTDVNGLLIVRFGYGVYLGGPRSPRGEIELYYDHRHDGLVGGLALDMHDPNIFGHVGLAATAHLRDGWAVKVAQGIGSASVTSIGLARAWGGGP